MTSSVVQAQCRDTKLTKSPPIIKQCYWNLAGMLRPTKYTWWCGCWCCFDNIFGSSLFPLQNQILPCVAAQGKIYNKGSCKLHVDADGEDWRHWNNLLEIRFTKETSCLLFSMPDFPQFIITFICCVKQMKQELISWAHSSLLISIFEISKTG